jgi:hypothetical protein
MHGTQWLENGRLYAALFLGEYTDTAHRGSAFRLKMLEHLYKYQYSNSYIECHGMCLAWPLLSIKEEGCIAGTTHFMDGCCVLHSYIRLCACSFILFSATKINLLFNNKDEWWDFGKIIVAAELCWLNCGGFTG